MERRSCTHPLRWTMRAPLQQSPARRPGRSGELCLFSVKGPITEASVHSVRPGHQGEGFFKKRTITSLNGQTGDTVGPGQNHGAPCVNQSLYICEQLSAAVLARVYTRRPICFTFGVKLCSKRPNMAAFVTVETFWMSIAQPLSF